MIDDSFETLQDRIMDSISSYVESGHSERSMLILPRSDYRILKKCAKSTFLGRFFTSNGLSLFGLDVYEYNGDRIVVN